MEEILQALEEHKEYILSETQSSSLEIKDFEGGEIIEIDGIKFKIKITKLA
jgi:hypothetical protein